MGKCRWLCWRRFSKQKNIEFWNLGHPYMQYKTDLGAHIESPNDFLTRWDMAIDFKSPDISGYRELQKNMVLKEQVKNPGS